MVKSMKSTKTISDELAEIQKKNRGLLDPAKVVAYAKNPNTLLHSKFEWDDKKASEEYRLEQARRIIRLELVVIKPSASKPSTIIANIKDADEGDKIVRAFVSLPMDRKKEKRRGYRDILSVMNNQSLRNQLLQEARREMLAFQTKYGTLEELADVFEAMNKVPSLAA